MRYIGCLLLLSAVVILSGCGGENVPPGPYGDWSITLAMDGAGRSYTQTTWTIVGTKAGASDDLDANDKRAPLQVEPEDAFVTSLGLYLDGREYIRDYRSPMEINPKTWLIKVPAGSGKKTLYAWNSSGHDIHPMISISLQDQSGKYLWISDHRRNGSVSDPACAVQVDDGTILTLTASLVQP